MSSYLYLMAWNEILARVFDGFEAQRNVSPEWLVNPGTKRRLKIDYLYPQIGVAVRFVGLQVKGAGRKSDWEEMEDASRDEVRKELCRLHEIDLLLLSPVDSHPSEQFKQIGVTLSAASRRLAKAGRFRGKADVMEGLSQARKRLDDIRRRVNKTEDLTPYAELWRDRETAAIIQAQKPPPRANSARRALTRFKVGQLVRHSHFGSGVVTALESKEDDTYVTVNFVTAGERTLAASLVGDKLVAERG